MYGDLEDSSKPKHHHQRFHVPKLNTLFTTMIGMQTPTMKPHHRRPKTLQGLEDDVAFQNPSRPTKSSSSELFLESDVYEAISKRSMVKLFGHNGLDLVNDNEIV